VRHSRKVSKVQIEEAEIDVDYIAALEKALYLEQKDSTED
jgi:hypothetical protein